MGWTLCGCCVEEGEVFGRCENLRCRSLHFPQSEMHEIYNDIKTSKDSFGMDVIVTSTMSPLGILSVFLLFGEMNAMV